MSLMENLVPKATLVGPEDNVNESETDIDALFDSIIAEAGLTTEGPEVDDEPVQTDTPAENAEPVTEGEGEEEIVDDVATAVDDADDDDLDLGDDDDFDPDDLSDEELAALDKELTDGELDDIADTGSEAEVTLSPEEEIDADDMMNLAATTMLVKDELSVEERVAFLKNTEEVNQAINEGFLTDADVTEMAMELNLVDDVVTEAKYNNRMIIKLDAASKKKQLYALAVNVSAAAHNDKDYIKLKKVMKMRKILRAKLAKKYHGEATKRMKIYFKRLNASKSSTLNSIGNRNK